MKQCLPFGRFLLGEKAEEFLHTWKIQVHTMVDSKARDIIVGKPSKPGTDTPWHVTFKKVEVYRWTISPISPWKEAPSCYGTVAGSDIQQPTSVVQKAGK